MAVPVFHWNNDIWTAENSEDFMEMKIALKSWIFENWGKWALALCECLSMQRYTSQGHLHTKTYQVVNKE